MPCILCLPVKIFSRSYCYTVWSATGIIVSSVCRPSVCICLSVCLLVCLSCGSQGLLVDQEHISWKSWKLIAQQLAQHLRFSQPKGHPPTPRGKWGNLGDLGWGKLTCWSAKAAIISDTRKDREKVSCYLIVIICCFLRNYKRIVHQVNGRWWKLVYKKAVLSLLWQRNRSMPL